MGLNVSDIIPREEIDVKKLKGKTLCVDAFNAIYQFLSTIRQADGTPLMDSKERITSHLSGIFYRNVNLLCEGIKLVYVFDGKPPELKNKTHRKRKELRENAREKYETAKREEDLSGMKKYVSQISRLNDEMIKESKELLNAMGIAVVQAPGEGESEAAHLCRTKNEVHASVSQDYDSLLFGTPKLIRNLTLSSRRKTFSGWTEVKPEIIELEKVLETLEINLNRLICLGILVGTDYNPKGIPGIGQKKALQLVQKHEDPESIFAEVEEKINSLPQEDFFDWKEIFDLFRKADVKGENFSFMKTDEKKIKEILVERHDFSEERIEKQLGKLREIREKSRQKELGKWF